MALPKSILLWLGDNAEDSLVCEDALRKVGFATATVHWKEVAARHLGWTELLHHLTDTSLVSFVIAGNREDFTPSVFYALSMTRIGLRNKNPLTMALISDVPLDSLPQMLADCSVFLTKEAFAPKLMAARFKPSTLLELPFYLDVHLDMYLGQWLETGPLTEKKEGIMLGVNPGAIVAHGVGERGSIPERCTLNHPMLGIEASWGEIPLYGAAVKNILTPETSYYIKLEGEPRYVFVGDYPEGENEHAYVLELH